MNIGTSTLSISKISVIYQWSDECFKCYTVRGILILYFRITQTIKLNKIYVYISLRLILGKCWLETSASLALARTLLLFSSIWNPRKYKGMIALKSIKRLETKRWERACVILVHNLYLRVAFHIQHALWILWTHHYKMQQFLNLNDISFSCDILNDISM